MHALTQRLAQRALPIAMALGVASSLGACVDQVGDINRLSEDVIPKTVFEGVWIYQMTTVDVPYSSAISFTGEVPYDLTNQGKIIFDIQEDWLIAYPVIERVEGTEEGYRVQQIRKYWDPEHRDEFVDMYVSGPLAMWPIKSHFDVIRNYNTYNGAQSNEFVENTTDRPWWARDYIRVAWHDQQVGQFFYDLAGGHGRQSYYAGQDKDGQPDELTLDPETGYIDFVVRTNVAALGQGYCSIFGLSPYDCSPVEVKVRHAFRRLDSRRDYEPLRYHNNEHQDKFGYFLTERPAYDEDWGPTYEGTVSLANRWNIWKRSYTFQKPTDAEGNALDIACGSDLDCDEAVGERCQKDAGWFEEGYCATPVPLPLRERGHRPIIYHVNADWHPDYMAEAYGTAEGWNDTFREAVSWMMFYEERGEYDVRACTSHADCASADLVVDLDATVTYTGIPCHAAAECGSAACGGDGFCANTRTCGAGNPCAVGQTCSAGVCQVGGQPVEERVPTTSLRGSTVVYYGAGALMTHDNFADATLAQLANNEAWVRFVNVTPDAGPLGLSVNGVGLPGGAFSADLDYDPQDPATAPFLAKVPAGTGLTFSVNAGGAEVGAAIGDIVAKNSYTVLYNGQDVLVYGASFNDSRRGVRFIHAAPNEGKLDFSLAGVRLQRDVSYRKSTGYQNIAGAVQRVAVTRAGTRGDITCYTASDIGRCVGWGADLTDADYARREEIKATIPDLFVICQNQYDSLEAMDEGNRSAGQAAKARVLNDTDYSGYYGDAWYTYALPDGSLYNPCGDPELVAHPEDLKKIGDIRYSFFYWINDAQRAGPLGYGPSLSDPDTGQIIHATANIYGGAVHTYGQYAQDLIDLVNGDLSVDSVTTGRWIREYLKNKNEVEPDPVEQTVFGALANAVPVQVDVDAALGRLDDAGDVTGRHGTLGGHHHGPFGGHDHDVRTLLRPQRPAHDYEFPELIDYMRDPESFVADVQTRLPPAGTAVGHERLQKIRGTWMEQLLLNDEVMVAAQAIDPAGEMSFDALAHELSPATWASKAAMHDRQQQEDLLARRNIYMADFVDDTLFGLAKQLKEEQGLSGPALRLEISRRILRGVLEHEVGHTVGLRHNFSGSTDVFNFHDEYYGVREKEVVLCQADGWCDELSNEACAIQSCASDSECLAGLVCLAGSCSAPSDEAGTNLVPTGICSRPVGSTPCATNSQCDDGQICHDGQCHLPSQQFVPRSWMSDNERANRRTQYQYTTTMDYGGRFNSDIEGLGKYDYAAIAFGYGQLVHTYKDTSKLRERVELASQLTGSPTTQWSFFLNSDYWPNRGTGFFHPFNYLTNYIGVEENLQRVPRPYEQVKYQQQMVTNDVREFIDFEYVEVPYAFCSDEYRGNMGCYYFDVGIDAGEMASHARDQLEQYYIFDAFKQERLFYGQYGNAMGYYSRIMDRYLRVLGDVGMYYAFFETLLFRYSWYQEWKDSPMGGRVYERAARDSFGYLQDVVSSPAPGSYVYDAESDAYVNVSFEPGAPGSQLDIPLGVGRYPYTRFGYELGYTYAEHPLWFGSFWEKVASLLTLTDSTAYFVDVSVGEQLNIGVGTSLGYNTVFNNDMNSFLGGIIAGEMPLYTGRVIQGKYTPPSLAMRQPLGTSVEPSLNNFTLKMYSALFGLAYLPAGFDPRFIDATAVFLEEEATHFSHAGEPGIVEHRFEDPIGGKVYVAYSNNYAGFGTVNISAGPSLIDRAQDLADQWSEATGPERMTLEAQLADVREILDVLRGLNHVYGASTLGF